MNQGAKIFLTLGILIYGIAPLVADLNETHLFHPDWTPHSRLHMAWLLTTNTSIAVIALYLAWLRNDVVGAGVLSLCVLGGFWIAALASPLYGGAFSDVGGIDIRILDFDGNTVGFGIAVLCIVAGLVLNRRSTAM